VFYLRLFIAVPFNNELKKEFHRISMELKQQTQSGSYTELANYHLTLVFIGETDNIQAVQKAMNELKAESFSLKIGELGHFYRPEGNIIWLGFKESPELNHIQRQIALTLKKRGFPIDQREYRPHLTLGRKVIINNKAKLSQLDIRPVQSQEIFVNRICLMKSERLAGRLVYTEIYSKGLE
jgi:2'-5' RNA ligase